jgi:hypothetical protein
MVCSSRSDSDGGLTFGPVVVRVVMSPQELEGFGLDCFEPVDRHITVSSLGDGVESGSGAWGKERMPLRVPELCGEFGVHLDESPRVIVASVEFEECRAGDERFAENRATFAGCGDGDRFDEESLGCVEVVGGET